MKTGRARNPFSNVEQGEWPWRRGRSLLASRTLDSPTASNVPHSTFAGLAGNGMCAESESSDEVSFGRRKVFAGLPKQMSKSPKGGLVRLERSSSVLFDTFGRLNSRGRAVGS